MLTVLSQPFLRQRQAVQCVTPTCCNHAERLMMARPEPASFEIEFSFTPPHWQRVRSGKTDRLTWGLVGFSRASSATELQPDALTDFFQPLRIAEHLLFHAGLDQKRP